MSVCCRVNVRGFAGFHGLCGAQTPWDVVADESEPQKIFIVESYLQLWMVLSQRIHSQTKLYCISLNAESSADSCM